MSVYQLAMLAQKMLPNLQHQRLKYWSDVHCSCLSASWWAGQAASQWNPCGVITEALQDAPALTRAKLHVSFMLPPVRHKTDIPQHKPHTPVEWVLFWPLYALFSSLHGLTWWKTCLWEWFWLLLKWAWLLVNGSCILAFNEVQQDEKWVSAALEIPTSWKRQVKAIDNSTRQRIVPVEKCFKKVVQERVRWL